MYGETKGQFEDCVMVWLVGSPVEERERYRGVRTVQWGANNG